MMPAGSPARSSGGRILRAVPAALVLAVLVSAITMAGGARAQLIRGFSEDLFLSANSSVRDRWMARAESAGADLVSIGLSWRSVAPGARPTDPRDPGDPAYDFSRLDEILRTAESRGLEILILVNRAPRWAEGRGRPRWAEAGTWKPSPQALGAFAEALARRYSGGYADALGLLPRVRFFEPWNEPNLNLFLAPQQENGRPFSPSHYRKMLNAFYKGVKTANPQAKVIGPSTAPFGGPSSSRGGPRVRPLRFVRGVLCVDKRGRREPGCGSGTRLDILGHHPINPASGPRARTRNRDDITVSGMKRLRRTLRRAERAGTVRPAGRRPVWATEIWWFTKSPPGWPAELAASPRQQARYLQESAYLLWRQGVKAMIWHQIADDRGLHSGLFNPSGRPKPSLKAYRFPFVAERRSRNRILAWGIPPKGGQVVIERMRRGRWRRIASVRGVSGRPFKTKVRVRGPARMRARVAGVSSLSWRQSA